MSNECQKGWRCELCDRLNYQHNGCCVDCGASKPKKEKTMKFQISTLQENGELVCSISRNGYTIAKVWKTNGTRFYNFDFLSHEQLDEFVLVLKEAQERLKMVQFRELRTGQKFQYDGTDYIRIDTIHGKRHSFNCIDLDDEVLALLSHDILVKRIEK